MQCFYFWQYLFNDLSYSKKIGTVGKILECAYIFRSFVFQNSFKKVKKNEKENLLLLTERRYKNNFYINRELDNTWVQKYKNRNSCTSFLFKILPFSSKFWCFYQYPFFILSLKSGGSVFWPLSFFSLVKWLLLCVL